MFRSQFSYSNSKSSYSDLLEDIETGKIESIFFYPRKREIDVLRESYLQMFINDLRDVVKYDKSSSYITSSLAATENTNVVNP